jgi:hypothetical protein
MKEYILGGIDPIFFSACVFFAGVGILFVLLLGTNLRDKRSPTSPEKFSWKYLWNDNTKRIAASIIATLVSLRFMTELTGWELNQWRSFCIGCAFDGIALFIKQKTNFLDPKPKS